MRELTPAEVTQCSGGFFAIAWRIFLAAFITGAGTRAGERAYDSLVDD